MNSTVMASPLSIATSIIHAASQVCSTSGISGTDDPLPSPDPVAVSLKPTSPATNQPLSSPSTPKSEPSITKHCRSEQNIAKYSRSEPSSKIPHLKERQEIQVIALYQLPN